MKPGDKVEVVGSKCFPADDLHLIGKRGVIVENDPYVVIVAMLAGGGDHRIVTVEIDDVQGLRAHLVCCITALRKIDDDDRPATWGDIEKLTGWKRPAVPA